MSTLLNLSFIREQLKRRGTTAVMETEDVLTILDEIEALREKVEQQRLELCRYDDAWCETDEERQLRPRS